MYAFDAVVNWMSTCAKVHEWKDSALRAGDL